ncbi:MAG: PHP domain-containing protein [Candidatus Omnitrophica bacterium]|nr:PHP domain-containing protein [Candidatus Omnitrophota bacterium]
MTKDLFADLHIHTYYSDGTSSPGEVVDEAVKNGLSCIAITDHDVADGVLPAQEAARGLHLEVIAGIELSSELEDKDIHILGYFIDIHKGPLVDKLESFLDERVRRMKQMIVNLQAVGIKDITFEEAAALTKSRAVGRAHLAVLLLQKGHVSSFKDAFEKYLAQGRPGYAPKFKQTPFEAIDLIHQNGGLAVMAHPMLTQKDELIPRLVKAGLDGIEVYYPNCMPTVTEFYKKIAKKNGLLMTGGSDAHGKAKVYTYVGKEAIPYELVEKMKAKLYSSPLNGGG